MNLVDLFTGIMGFSIAAHKAGIKTIAVSEIDKFCCELIKLRMPGVRNLGDIKDHEQWEINESIDILAGGFPCQPVSCAGKRRGKSDNRWLWQETLNVTKRLKPDKCVFENVAGLASLFQYETTSPLEGREYKTREDAEADFDKTHSEEQRRVGRNLLHMVVEELAEAGYDVQPVVIPASAVNAPHRRYRVFIVSFARRGNGTKGTDHDERSDSDDPDSQCPGLQNGQLDGQSVSGGNRKRENSTYNEPETPVESCDDPDSPQVHDRRHIGIEKERQVSESGNCVEPGVASDSPIITDREEDWQAAAARLCGSDYEVSGELDGRDPSGKFVGTRVNRLSALGNAVVPQVAYEIFKAIMESE